MDLLLNIICPTRPPFWSRSFVFPSRSWWKGQCLEILLGLLDLAEVLEHRVNHLESLVDFLTNFGTGEDNLAANED